MAVSINRVSNIIPRDNDPHYGAQCEFLGGSRCRGISQDVPVKRYHGTRSTHQ